MQEIGEDTHPMKRCPRCAEDIRAEAVLCRYCGAEFTNYTKGYCPSCHRAVLAGEAGCCPDCGGELLDVHIESALAVGEHPAPASESPATTEEVGKDVGRGPTRAGIVPTGREAIGYRLLTIASGALFLLVLWSIVGLGIAGSSQDAWPLTYWYERPVVLGTEYGGPPILLILLVLAGSIFQPKLLKPRTGNAVVRLARQGGYIREFKKRFGGMPISASSLTTMLVGSAVTWTLSLIVVLAFLNTWSGEAGTVIGALPKVALILCVGALTGVGLMWPTSRTRRIEMEDDGTVHG